MSRTRATRPAVPATVAHRGAAERFPENTLAAVGGAVDCGVRFIEIDVQLSADRVPVLLHDASLLRTGGRDVMATATVARELCVMPAGEPSRFGDEFAASTVPTLAETLAGLPGEGVTVFVELKRHSLLAFGRNRVLDAVVPVLRNGPETVLISFDRKVLELARVRGVARTGWVLGVYDRDTLDEAERLAPDYLFCNQQRLPEGDAPLRRGCWDWVIYEVTDVATARRLAARGVGFVESMAACRLRRELGA